jgi:sortase A
MMKTKEQTEERTVCTPTDDQQARGARWPVLRKIQAALLTVGLALGTTYVAARIESHFASRTAIERFESGARALGVEEHQAPESNLQAAEPDFNGWGMGRIRAYALSARKVSSAPLAVLQIPKIHLEAPVFDGTDTLTLNHAVGRIAGTAMPGEPGNVGLAGHRDGFFRRLKEIQPGDEIDLKTHGGTAVYTVDQIQIVNPHDVSVLEDQEKPALTLITCYPFYFVGSAPERYVVTAFLKQQPTTGSTATETRLNIRPFNPTLEEL